MALFVFFISFYALSQVHYVSINREKKRERMNKQADERRGKKEKRFSLSDL